MICSLVKFYEGGIDLEAIETMPYPKLAKLHKNAVKINKIMNGK